MPAAPRRAGCTAAASGVERVTSNDLTANVPHPTIDIPRGRERERPTAPRSTGNSRAGARTGSCARDREGTARASPAAHSGQRSAFSSDCVGDHRVNIVRFTWPHVQEYLWRNCGEKHNPLYQEDLLVSSRRAKKLRPHSTGSTAPVGITVQSTPAWVRGPLARILPASTRIAGPAQIGGIHRRIAVCNDAGQRPVHPVGTSREVIGFASSDTRSPGLRSRHDPPPPLSSSSSRPSGRVLRFWVFPKSAIFFAEPRSGDSEKACLFAFSFLRKSAVSCARPRSGRSAG